VGASGHQLRTQAYYAGRLKLQTGLLNQAGAAELALPGRRRSGPLGGQGATRK